MIELARATVFAFFIAHGYDADHTAALMRLAHEETRFQHWQIARSGSSCLYQWVGARKRPVMSAGRCVDLQQQLEHADRELRAVDASGQRRYECFWQARGAAAFQQLRRTFAHGGRC
jgi:hypothetical protein